MMMCACLFTCHMPLPSTNGVGKPVHTCATSQNRNLVAGTCMFTSESNQHHYMVACEYLFTHMHYPSTISGSVGKTICPYTMCLHHQVSAWDVCSLTCRVTVSLHFTVDSSFYMHFLCWCYHVAANVHPCLHISSVPTLPCGSMDMCALMWTMTQHHDMVASSCMFTYEPCPSTVM